MRLLRLATAEDVANAAADIVCARVAEDPDLVLTLPTGKTAIPLYAELAARYARGELDLARARAFNLDELLLPRGHPASFASFMRQHAWERIGLDRSRCDIPDPEADPAAECRRYDTAIAAAGGLDLALLGLGADGHVAYNLPGEPRDETHVVALPEAVAESLSVPAAARPLRAITIGLRPLREARRVVLLATTPDKERALRQLVDGPADPAWPCSLLRDHPRLDVLIVDSILGDAA